MEETMEKYRILQIHNFYQIPGGEDVVVRNEKKLLEEHGHEVFTYYRSNKELNEGNKLKKLFIPFTAVYSLKTCREVKKIIRENKIDIVHVHNTLMMVSPSVFYAAFQCKVPVVQTLHNFRMLCPAGSFFRNNVICEECVDGGLKCAIRHKCYRGSKIQTMVSSAILWIHRFLGTYYRVNFICLTEFNKNKLLSSLDPGKKIVDPKRVYIKPNFTFADGIVPVKKQPEEEYYLFAGRVEALKGIDIAVKAFEKLPDKILYVAGTVGRIGGDEFAFCYAGELEPERIRHNADKILEILRTQHVNEQTGEVLPVPCSIGIVMSQGDTLDYTQLIRKADLAMYQAKENGKNTFVLNVD